MSRYLPSGEKAGGGEGVSWECGVRRVALPLITSAIKTSEFLPVACCCVYAIHLPSYDQIGRTFPSSLGVLFVSARYRLVSTSMMLISNVDELRGFEMYAM